MPKQQREVSSSVAVWTFSRHCHPAPVPDRLARAYGLPAWNCNLCWLCTEADLCPNGTLHSLLLSKSYRTTDQLLKRAAGKEGEATNG